MICFKNDPLFLYQQLGQNRTEILATPCK